MSLLDLCERIQSTALSEFISQSTWGYPVVGALHVLAIALFGGVALIPHLRALGLIFRREDRAQLCSDVRSLRWIGLLSVVLTGALLFAAQASYYYGSSAFRLKLILLGAIALNAATYRSAWISLTLWAAVIFAARGIAFY